MNQHRKVQSIGRGPQSFTRSAQSPIQSPMPPQSAQYRPMQQWAPPPEPVYSVEEDIQDLAMEIYARLAIDHIRTTDAAMPEVLQDLAKDSRIAAQAFFEEQTSEEV